MQNVKEPPLPRREPRRVNASPPTQVRPYTARPYLVVPFDDDMFDEGDRDPARPNPEVFHSDAIHVLPITPVRSPDKLTVEHFEHEFKHKTPQANEGIRPGDIKANGAYWLVCDVKNFGAVGAYGVTAYFYAVSPADLHAMPDPRSKPKSARLIGIGTHIVPPGGVVRSVLCTTAWVVKPGEEQFSILVYITDIADPVISRFDAAADRHVGRLDWAGNF